MMVMMETNLTALFRVIFFDGEREIDLGTVQITPSLNFKAFQSIMSQKIGISPHQITSYFQRNPSNNNNNNNNNNHRRRQPVTNKFDFSSILLESSSAFFWVVLKRSRRVRRRRPRNPQFSGDDLSPENFVLLRRNYMMSLNLNSNVYCDLSYGGGGFNGGGGFSDDGGSSSGGASSVERYFCDVCFNARGETVPFHSCKNDVVTMGFRSPAGPIAPPSKNRLFG